MPNGVGKRVGEELGKELLEEAERLASEGKLALPATPGIIDAMARLHASRDAQLAGDLVKARAQADEALRIIEEETREVMLREMEQTIRYPEEIARVTRGAVEVLDPATRGLEARVSARAGSLGGQVRNIVGADAKVAGEARKILRFARTKEIIYPVTSDMLVDLDAAAKQELKAGEDLMRSRKAIEGGRPSKPLDKAAQKDAIAGARAAGATDVAGIWPAILTGKPGAATAALVARWAKLSRRQKLLLVGAAVGVAGPYLIVKYLEQITFTNFHAYERTRQLAFSMYVASKLGLQGDVEWFKKRLEDGGEYLAGDQWIAYIPFLNMWHVNALMAEDQTRIARMYVEHGMELSHQKEDREKWDQGLSPPVRPEERGAAPPPTRQAVATILPPDVEGGTTWIAIQSEYDALAVAAIKAAAGKGNARWQAKDAEGRDVKAWLVKDTAAAKVADALDGPSPIKGYEAVVEVLRGVAAKVPPPPMPTAPAAPPPGGAPGAGPAPRTGAWLEKADYLKLSPAGKTWWSENRERYPEAASAFADRLRKQGGKAERVVGGLEPADWPLVYKEFGGQIEHKGRGRAPRGAPGKTPEEEFLPPPEAAPPEERPPVPPGVDPGTWHAWTQLQRDTYIRLHLTQEQRAEYEKAQEAPAR